MYALLDLLEIKNIAIKDKAMIERKGLTNINPKETMAKIINIFPLTLNLVHFSSKVFNSPFKISSLFFWLLRIRLFFSSSISL